MLHRSSPRKRLVNQMVRQTRRTQVRCTCIPSLMFEGSRGTTETIRIINNLYGPMIHQTGHLRSRAIHFAHP
ncbi:hypothetical protein M404DRAFT_534590 [Pisolithus tinctorius Marx 270]|uniref:Uncharacterized protein n=1 Tax=Pisolithus tinctorius Marx 270 TaxID=870435 RepID=A0A0C3J7Z6_PISTI|nr:hypothetical protein M404DRAFT_534590 [Pisolithus tinctorius Marx 270]